MAYRATANLRRASLLAGQQLLIPNKAELAAEHDAINDALRGTGDVFMMKGELDETVKESRWSIILSNRALYKIEGDGSSVRNRRELVDFHSIIPDPSDPAAFLLYSYKSAAALQADKVKGVFGLGMDFDSFLQQRRFVCDSAHECFEWVLVLNRLVRDAWQRTFEASFIPNPEVYQFHAFVIKLNSKGVAQERTLVMSNEWIYNVEMTHNPTRVKEMKWALPIFALKQVTLSLDSGRPCATFGFDAELVQALMDQDHMGAKKGNTNDNHSFIFHDENVRKRTLRELERLVYRISGFRLAVNNQEDANNSIKSNGSDNNSSTASDSSSSSSSNKAEEAKASKAEESKHDVEDSEPIDPSRVELRGQFKKATRYGWSVSRYCYFNSSGDIEWSEAESTKKKMKERVTAARLSAADPKEFILETTGKELSLEAESAAEAKHWVTRVCAVLNHLSQRNAMGGLAAAAAAAAAKAKASK